MSDAKILLWIFMACTLVFVGIWVLGAPMIIWDGSIDLTVTVTSAKKINGVTCQAFGDQEWAKQALNALQAPQGGDLYWTSLRPFEGEPITIVIPTSGRSGVLFELSRGWFRYLVVIAEFEGGERQGQLVSVPDPHESRDGAVHFP